MSSSYQRYVLTEIDDDGSVVLPNIADSRHIVIGIHADASSTLTFKVQGSASEAVPSFGDASSSTNDWSFIAIRNLSTGSLIAGATGVSLSSATHHQLYEVESNALSHAAIQVSGHSAGGIVPVVFVKED